MTAAVVVVKLAVAVVLMDFDDHLAYFCGVGADRYRLRTRPYLLSLSGASYLARRRVLSAEHLLTLAATALLLFRHRRHVKRPLFRLL